MRKLTPDEFFAVTGLNKATFKTHASRGESALAFGTAYGGTAGVFTDVDCAAWAALDELTPAFGRKFGSTIVRGFSDELLEAIHSAEQTAEPVFFMVTEAGPFITGDAKMRLLRDQVNATSIKLSDFANFKLRGRKMIPDRITMFNVTSLLRRVRENAARHRIDLSSPFIPSLDAIGFKEFARDVRKIREQHRAEPKLVRPSA